MAQYSIHDISRSNANIKRSEVLWKKTITPH
jgi:hypothetical protein